MRIVSLSLKGAFRAARTNAGSVNHRDLLKGKPARIRPLRLFLTVTDRYGVVTISRLDTNLKEDSATDSAINIQEFTLQIGAVLLCDICDDITYIATGLKVLTDDVRLVLCQHAVDLLEDSWLVLVHMKQSMAAVLKGK